jgi:predicted DNA-binding transcriptional regulator
MVLGEQFFKMRNAIFHYGLTPIQLATYSYLVSCAGQKRYCWPGMRTIAASCSCSKNAARDAVNELVRRKLIRKVECYKDYTNGKSRQTSNRYFILEPPPLPKPSADDEVAS